MTTPVKKAGRKSNAEKAAEAAAQAATQELAKVEVIEGEKVVTDLEPETKLEAPISDSVDPNGEDLGDVTPVAPETPVIESGEATEPVDIVIEGGELPESTEIDAAAEIDEVLALPVVKEAFTPILVPTMVGDERKGHIPCPKAVWELVQIEGWQETIGEHPVHVQNGLKSVLYWQIVNGDVKVRCQSSSRFAEAK